MQVDAPQRGEPTGGQQLQMRHEEVHVSLLRRLRLVPHAHQRAGAPLVSFGVAVLHSEHCERWRDVLLDSFEFGSREQRFGLELKARNRSQCCHSASVSLLESRVANIAEKEWGSLGNLAIKYLVTHENGMNLCVQ